MFIKVVNSTTELYMLSMERLLQINSLSDSSVDLIFNDASAPETSAVIVITLAVTVGKREDVIDCIHYNIQKTHNENKLSFVIWDSVKGIKPCPNITGVTVNKKYK